MRILVICGDRWHPMEVIKRGLSLVERQWEEPLEFDYICDAKDILTPEMLKEYRAVIIAKGNQGTVENGDPWFEKGITETGPEDFLNYLLQGGGILSLHAGNCFEKEKCGEYTDMTGSSFMGHPPRCEISCRVVQGHPITEGVKDFTIRDEHYMLELLTEDREEFLSTSSEKGGVQTGGYVRTMGKGRLCVLTPGHIFATFKSLDMQRLLLNAILWCSGEIV